MYIRYAMTKKKLIGTSILLVTIIGTLLLGASLTQARFRDSLLSIRADGTVDDVDTDSITILTNGSDPITFAITDDTNFLGQTDLSDIDPGDFVRVRGRRTNGSYEARSIKLQEDETAYGQAGENVYVREGAVVAKGSDNFTINNGVVDITFQLTPDTRFIGINFPFLEIGDNVRVRGEDTGTSFIAESVRLKD